MCCTQCILLLQVRIYYSTGSSHSYKAPCQMQIAQQKPLIYTAKEHLTDEICQRKSGRVTNYFRQNRLRSRFE